jgi:hypothetical protein
MSRCVRGSRWAPRSTRPAGRWVHGSVARLKNAHVTGDRRQTRSRWRGRGARGLAVVVCALVAGFVVVAWPHARHFSLGLPPQQFRDELDPALLTDYSGVLGVAHNAANRIDTLQVALDHGADVVEADLISVRGELVAGRDQPMSWLTNRILRGPTLAQVWDAAEPADVLKLDLKRDDAAFLDDLVTFLAPRQGSREVMVATRDRDAIVRLHRDLPEITLLLSIGFPEGVQQLRSDAELQTAIGGVTIFQGLVDATLVGWLHERDLLVLAWPVNDVQRLNNLVRLSVDGVTTANLAILEVLA